MGKRQNALLEALDVHGAVWVVPDGSSRCEAVSWRRAARSLVLENRARAVYVRKLDAYKRYRGHLVLTHINSRLPGDSFPLHVPAWIARPDTDEFFLESLSLSIVASVLEHQLGYQTKVSQETAGLLMRRMRKRNPRDVSMIGQVV